MQLLKKSSSLSALNPARSDRHGELKSGVRSSLADELQKFWAVDFVEDADSESEAQWAPQTTIAFSVGTALILWGAIAYAVLR